MAKIEFASVSTMDVKAVENVVTIRGKSSRGKPTEVSFPLKAFAMMAAEALRGARVQDRLSAGPLTRQGDWTELVPIQVRTVDVGILPMGTQPTVVVMLDRGLETELSFPLSAESAREIGQKMIAESERAKSGGLGPSH